MKNLRVCVPRTYGILAIGMMALARVGAAQASALTTSDRRDVVDTIASQLERIYVDADTGRLIANHLRERLRAGVYDTVGDPIRLSQLLTGDLRSVNHDLHLSVTYNSSGAAGSGRAAGPLAFLSKAQHFALGRVDVLPGNIGYMEVNGFSVEPGARDAIVGALTYLQTTDAMILDLRRNRGGDANLVNSSSVISPAPIPWRR